MTILGRSAAIAVVLENTTSSNAAARICFFGESPEPVVGPDRRAGKRGLSLSGNFFALAADSYQAAVRLGLDSPVLRATI